MNGQNNNLTDSPVLLSPSIQGKRSRGLYLIVLLTVAIIFATGGYYLGRNRILAPKYLVSSGVYPSPTQVPLVDPTAGWKIYENSDYSFKYPPTFTLSDYTENDWNGVSLLYLGAAQVNSGRTETELFDGALIKTLFITGLHKSAQEYIQTSYHVDTNTTDESSGGTISPVQQARVGNRAAYYYFVHGHSETNIFFIDVNGEILRITTTYAGSGDAFSQYQPLIDNVLSTFKFKESVMISDQPQGPLDTSDWETYTKESPDSGFQPFTLKYPKTWKAQPNDTGPISFIILSKPPYDFNLVQGPIEKTMCQFSDADQITGPTEDLRKYPYKEIISGIGILRYAKRDIFTTGSDGYAICQKDDNSSQFFSVTKIGGIAFNSSGGKDQQTIREFEEILRSLSFH